MNTRTSRCIALLALAITCGAAAAASEAQSGFDRERSEVAMIYLALGMKPEGGIFSYDFNVDFDVRVEPIAFATCVDPLVDRDFDRLSDCAETGDATYRDRTATGTSPDNPDTDGDGILDGDEVLGTAAGLDLPALGTNPLRRDILLEYDWFDLATSECGATSHRPSAEAIARVATMFGNAPVRNPDGTTGINIIQDYGQGGATGGGNVVVGYDANLPGKFDATHAAIKAANFDPKRLGYFHYVLMAHRYNKTSNNSGYAETIGDDVLVTTQCARNPATVGNTIAHELGHNLGLKHGGFEDCNRKPNYNSIMNYTYQFSGVNTTCDTLSGNGGADFSRGTRPALNEAALDETGGVCGGKPVDFNADGTLQARIAFDLNPAHVAACSGALTKLEDFDDWSNLTYAGLMDKHGLLKNVQTETECPPAPSDDDKHAHRA